MKYKYSADGEQLYQKLQNLYCGIKPGDTVRLLRHPLDYELGWGCICGSVAGLEIGKEFKVITIRGASGVVIETHNCVPFFVCEVVKRAPRVVSVVLNSCHTAEVSKDGVKVGCQTFSLEAIKKLGEAIETVTKEDRP